MEELKIEADIKNLNTVLEFVNKVLEEADCSSDVMASIDIAVEEIFVNVAQYAYSSPKGNLKIIADVIEDINEFNITFIDKGVPFDPLKIKDPDIDIPLEEREVGGLGIYMVKMIMDRVKYEYKNGNNIFMFTKNLDEAIE